MPVIPRISQAQVAELQSKLEKGAGDETLKQQLKDAKAQVTQLQTQLQTKEGVPFARTSAFAALSSVF